MREPLHSHSLSNSLSQSERKFGAHNWQDFDSLELLHTRGECERTAGGGGESEKERERETVSQDRIAVTDGVSGHRRVSRTFNSVNCPMFPFLALSLCVCVCIECNPLTLSFLPSVC